MLRPSDTTLPQTPKVAQVGGRRYRYSPVGWYVDPSDPSRLRYFDGQSWTFYFVPLNSPLASAIMSPDANVRKRANAQVFSRVPNSKFMTFLYVGARPDSRQDSMFMPRVVWLTLGVLAVAGLICELISGLR